MNKSTILITGTSRGLGKSLAEHYLQKGYSVIGCARAQSAIFHESYTHFTLDIGNESDILEMFKNISDLKIPVKVLINNAGLTQSNLSLISSYDEMRKIIHVNLWGTYLITREMIKLMMKNRYGRIINFSSINVPLASVGSGMYSATKVGIDALSASLVKECGSADITINTVGLSLVADTGMLNNLSEKALLTKQNALVKQDLLGLNEVVHAVDFFISPSAKNITSQTLYFGGL